MNMNANVYVYRLIFIHICILHTCLHMYTYLCIYTCIQHTCICMHVSVRVSAYICTYVEASGFPIARRRDTAMLTVMVDAVLGVNL